MNTRSLLTALVVSIYSANAYIWPNARLDQLEHLRYDQTGYHSDDGFARFLNPCHGQEGGGGGNAADWIRTAFHDMATYDVNSGTGGMDGSIRLSEEQARDENRGDAFHDSIENFRTVGDNSTSMADKIALGTVVAAEHCGGPTIAFRGGRIDATVANAPGVPGPHFTIDQFHASFSRMGLSPTEMIEIVACGHTMGGVSHQDFPEIVGPEEETDGEGDVDFDDTDARFDNRVAYEYIHGTPRNPLVVGSNATFNSDLRIFSSDANATLTSMADSADVFNTKCARVLAKMLDTVPRGVSLSEVIEPLAVKPWNVRLTKMSGGGLKLCGEVRVWNIDPLNIPTVTIRVSRSGITLGSAPSTTLVHSPDMLSFARAGGVAAAWYSFDGSNCINIPPPLLSISVGTEVQLVFDVGGKKYDQGGRGFKVKVA